MNGYISSDGNVYETQREANNQKANTLKEKIDTEEARTNKLLSDVDVDEVMRIALRKKGQKIGDYGVPVSIREEIAPSVDRLERTP